MSPTLRSLSNMPETPGPFSESTLIMIDCQRTYTRGPLELAGVDAALDHAAALLHRARVTGITVLHIQHDDGAGSLFDVRAENGGIVDRVAARDANR
jgi:hypothetical protein